MHKNAIIAPYNIRELNETNQENIKIEGYKKNKIK